MCITGDEWDDIWNENPMLGIGLGIRIPVAISGNIRFDYGWSFYNGKYIEKSLLFGIGQKF